jgi:hypothetical protein
MSADVVTVAPGEVFAAHMGGNGDAGPISATVHVHRPTGRVVYQVLAENVMRLGPHVTAFREKGYSVTPWASEAGR